VEGAQMPLNYQVYLFIFSLTVLGIGLRALGLVLYHLHHVPSPFAFRFFFLIGAHTFGWSASKLKTFYLHLPSCYYRHVPPCPACFWDRVLLTFTQTGLEFSILLLQASTVNVGRREASLQVTSFQGGRISGPTPEPTNNIVVHTQDQWLD
jgi:hypothetical protein